MVEDKLLIVKDEPSGVPQGWPTDFSQAENSPSQGILDYNLENKIEKKFTQFLILLHIYRTLLTQIIQLQI